MSLLRVPQGLLHRASSPASTTLLVSFPGGQQTMGWVLLLLLLLLPTASLQVCRKGPHSVTQPKRLSAPEGGSISISFEFSCPWELPEDPDVRISWRWKEFHGPFFYNQTPHFIHEDFKNRLSLSWTKGRNTGSLNIQNLQKTDNSTYFCRIQLNTKTEGVQQWQSIDGTILTITPAAKTTMQSPTSKAPKTTTTGIKVTESKRSLGAQPLILGATVGGALATALLVIAILGLMVFRWKRRKGQPAKAPRPVSNELFPNTEEQYENVGNRDTLTAAAPAICPPACHTTCPQHSLISPQLRHNIDLRVNPKDDIVYASLSLSNFTLSGAAPGHTLHGAFPEETLYSVLKA